MSIFKIQYECKKYSIFLLMIRRDITIIWDYKEMDIRVEIDKIFSKIVNAEFVENEKYDVVKNRIYYKGIHYHLYKCDANQINNLTTIAKKYDVEIFNGIDEQLRRMLKEVAYL